MKKFITTDFDTQIRNNFQKIYQELLTSEEPAIIRKDWYNNDFTEVPVTNTGWRVFSYGQNTFNNFLNPK